MTAVPHVSLPPDVDLVVPQEITLSTPWMKAIAVYMGSSCEKEMNEYMLLRREWDNDPRKVLKEGREVTACGVRFIRELRKQCLDEVTAYARCLDHSKRGEMLPTNCRRVQYPLDICVEEKMGIKRPPVGHFSKLHVHESAVQPPPIRYNRDFKAEAKELMTELPDDWHLQRGRNRRYRPAYLDFFSNDT